MQLTIKKNENYVIIKDFIYMINDNKHKGYRVNPKPFKVFTPTLRSLTSHLIEITFHSIGCQLKSIQSYADNYYMDDQSTRDPYANKGWIDTSWRALIYDDKKLTLNTPNIYCCMPQSKISELMFPQNDLLCELQRDYDQYYDNHFTNEFNRLTSLKEEIETRIRTIQTEFQYKKDLYHKNVIEAVETAAIDFEENKAYRKNLIDYLVEE